MNRRWSPSRRRPELIRWSGAECAECGFPVEVVVLKADPLLDDGSRVAIERKLTGRRGEPGWIAARLVGDRMVGYRITKSRPLAAGYQAFQPHQLVCTEAPPPPHEQHSLFDTEEGTTTP